MDLDVKEGAYKSTKDAMVAMNDFLAQSAYPAANYHRRQRQWRDFKCILTLNTEFEPKEFRRMASQLVAAGTQHGLMFDKQCTSDALRLLRIPGTWNFNGRRRHRGQAGHLDVQRQARYRYRGDAQRFEQVQSYATPESGPGRSNNPSSKPSVNDDLIGEPPEVCACEH